MRCLVVVLLLALATTPARTQSEPRDENVVLRASIVGGERPFRIGETIPIQLTFSATIGDRYQIDMGSSNRSGGIGYEHIGVSPTNGSVDPLPKPLVVMLSAIASYKFLGPEPWTTQVNVNEWLRFTRPGKYQLQITSRRVEVKDGTTARGTTSMTVVANPIALTIVPSTAAWRKATLDGAVATLNQPVPARPPFDAYDRARSQAINTLRFLGSPDAIRELANCLRGDDLFGNRDGVCVTGLISAPDPAVARRALEAALVDPDRAITSQFLYALQMVSADRQAPNRWQQDRQRALEKLVAALPSKRGSAIVTSLATAVNEAWNFVPLPTATAEALVRQLIERFDQLPVDLQAALLETRWDKIRNPALLPLLRRSVAAFDDRLNSDNRDAARRLGAIAIQRWYELDPSGARPAIITEIIRPSPRYGARTLGLLPDRVLPEVDSPLAEHFATSGDPTRIASLIARYATGAILAPVLAKLDPLLGRWGCDTQAPILAYALRVDPALALPRIERALAARGDDFTGCYHSLLSEIAAIHYDPALEDLAIRSLDDPDHRAAWTSAQLLGEFGSPQMESVLLEHYRNWTEKWVGRDAELNPAFADRPQQQDALTEGHYVLQALTTGTSWLTDADELESLLLITKSARLRQMLEAGLRAWNNPPLIIGVNSDPGSARLNARVAQYEFHSMRALQDKLAQFQVGTPFALQLSGPEPARRLSEATLSAFLREHGMTVVAAR